MDPQLGKPSLYSAGRRRKLCLFASQESDILKAVLGSEYIKRDRVYVTEGRGDSAGTSDKENRALMSSNTKASGRAEFWSDCF